MTNLILKTAESEVRVDKNGKNYKLVTFTEAKMIQTMFGPLPAPAEQCKSRAITQYEESYLSTDTKKVKDLGYDAPIFNSKNPQAGGWFMGSIESRNVEEYEIPSDGIRNASFPTTFSTVIFGDTSSPSYESLVKAAFKSAGHPVVENTHKIPVITSVTAEATPSDLVGA